MDILYVLGKGSKWNNNELRYSLRSIEKFGKNVGNVYVIGHNPGFLSRNVTVLQIEDYMDAKHKNILNKIVKAVHYTPVADHFLLSSDDHFYIKETDFDNYPVYCKGLLPDVVTEGDKGKNYKKSLVDTRNILNEHGYTQCHFGWHGNTHITKEAITLAKDFIQQSFESTYGYEPTSLLLNVLYATKPFEIVCRIDLKLDDDINGVDSVIEHIGDSECFSISDAAVKLGVEEYLQQMFPDKSKYEI